MCILIFFFFLKTRLNVMLRGTLWYNFIFYCYYSLLTSRLLATYNWQVIPPPFYLINVFVAVSINHFKRQAEEVEIKVWNLCKLHIKSPKGYMIGINRFLPGVTSHKDRWRLQDNLQSRVLLNNPGWLFFKYFSQLLCALLFLDVG